MSELGHIQAKEFAQCFAWLLIDFKDPLLVSSPMRSALETAMPLVQRGAMLGPERFVCHAELFEIGANFYRDERPSQLAARLEADFMLTCCELPSDADYPEQSEGESDEQAAARVDRVCSWVHSLLERGEHPVIIMVAHSDLLSRCLRRWMGVPRSESLAFSHANAGVTVLQWTNDEGFVIECVNDQSHLIKGAGDGRDSWWNLVRRFGP